MLHNRELGGHRQAKPLQSVTESGPWLHTGGMQKAAIIDPLEAGRRALAAGEWGSARDHFTRALETSLSADALDGLGRARWWLRDTAGALEARTRAYTLLRRGGRHADAARLAVWLAREHRALYRNDPVAEGWLARARSLVPNDGGSIGWIELAEAEASSDPQAGIARLLGVLDTARAFEDADLEIVALAHLGVREVSLGEVAAGLAHLDEALTAAAAGEGTDPQGIGEAWCALMEVTGLLGERDRLKRWSSSVDAFVSLHDFVPLRAYGMGLGADALSAFCGTCCGGIHLVTGRLDDAEEVLIAALAELRDSGMESRCVHPASQLAQLRVLQGRLEEAEALLAGFEDRPECTRALAELALARGDAPAALAQLHRGIAVLVGQDVAAFGLWTVLIDAALADGDAAAADEAAATIERIATRTGSTLHEALARFGRAKVTTATKPDAGLPMLGEAATMLAQEQLPVEACRARLVYAAALVHTDRPAAIAQARGALAALERLGAVADADRTAAFLAELGVRGRTGPKDLGVLTGREQQVLQLVARGLTNPEIADRLKISVKTAGHHVSSILAKLGLRSRTEAAAFALMHLPSAPK